MSDVEPWTATDADEGRTCPDCGAMDVDGAVCDCGEPTALCNTCGWTWHA